MSGAPITLAKQAAKTFIEQLAPEGRVAVIGFSDEVRLLQDFTADHAAASTVIDTLSAAGNTALYKATAAATLKAGASNASRRAIVLQRRRRLRHERQHHAGASAPRREECGRADLRHRRGPTGRDYLQADRDASRTVVTWKRRSPSSSARCTAALRGSCAASTHVTFDAWSAPAGGDADISIGVTSNGRTATASGIYHVPVASAPTVTLEGISAGESLSEARTVTARVSGGAASRVTFSIDGVAVVDVDKAPYAFNYDPAAFPGGAHTLSASATWAGGAVHSDVSFASLAPPRPSSGSGSPMLLIAVGLLIVIVLGRRRFVVLRMRRKVAVPPGVRRSRRSDRGTPPITGCAARRQSWLRLSKIPTAC